MRDDVAFALAAFSLFWGIWVTCAGLFALVRRMIMDRRKIVVPEKLPPVLLVRPCAGAEPDLEACLRSVLEAKHSFRIIHRFATNAADDSAIPAIERACEAIRDTGAEASRLVIPATRPNRKTTLVAGMVAAGGGEKPPIIISCDSNVDLAGCDLDRLVAPLLTGEKVGASWVPHAERHTQGLGSRASVAVMGGSLTAFGLLSAMNPNGMVGKLFAVDRGALDRVGGFEALGCYLAEDLQLSLTLREAGYSIVAIPELVTSVRPRQPFVSAVQRVARWMTAVRAQHPGLFLTYPLFFFGMAIMVALAIPALDVHPVIAGSAIAMALGSRLGIGLAARIYSNRPWRPGAVIVDTVLADTVLFLAWMRAAVARGVEWRGHWLRLGPGGQLQGDDAIAESSPAESSPTAATPGQ